MVSQHVLHVRVWLGMFTVLSGSDFLKSWKFNIVRLWLPQILEV